MFVEHVRNYIQQVVYNNITSYRKYLINNQFKSIYSNYYINCKNWNPYIYTMCPQIIHLAL